MLDGTCLAGGEAGVPSITHGASSPQLMRGPLGDTLTPELMKVYALRRVHAPCRQPDREPDGTSVDRAGTNTRDYAFAAAGIASAI
jgi:hypothetical protein